MNSKKNQKTRKRKKQKQEESKPKQPQQLSNGSSEKDLKVSDSGMDIIDPGYWIEHLNPWTHSSKHFRKDVIITEIDD